MKIFSYGSNMNILRLRNRVPSATKITNAFIYNYSFACNKISQDGSSKANIIKTGNPNDVVHGVIFEIDENQKSDLDKAEGLGKGYRECILDFNSINEEIIQANVYIAEDNAIDNKKLPYDWYKIFITTGAEENKLPKEYINKISTIKCTTDPNVKRRNKQLQIINFKNS